MQSDFEFTLSKDVTYAEQGQIEATKILLLKAPAAKHAPLIMRIKQQIWRAFKSQIEENQKNKVKASKNDDDGSLTGAMMVQLLYSSSVVNIEDFLEDFKQLLIRGCCVIPPKRELQEEVYDKIPCDDLEKMMGEYLVNFLLSSILPKNS